MSEWTPVRLGEVTTQVRDAVKVAVGPKYPLLGVKWYAEGPFLRETVSSETSKATTLYRVSPGQFIYNRMFAWKGAFGIVGDGLAGSFVSNEFLCSTATRGAFCRSSSVSTSDSRRSGTGLPS